jgi:hypothetical protein
MVACFGFESRYGSTPWWVDAYLGVVGERRKAMKERKKKCILHNLFAGSDQNENFDYIGEKMQIT